MGHKKDKALQFTLRLQLISYSSDSNDPPLNHSLMSSITRTINNRLQFVHRFLQTCFFSQLQNTFCTLLVKIKCVRIRCNEYSRLVQIRCKNNNNNIIAIVQSTVSGFLKDSNTTALCGTGYRKRTAQILRVTHFYDLLMQ